MSEDEQLVTELERRHPHAVRLAECVSLAVYAEPALLRRMRHEALPGVDAAAEADLWFSDLVVSATPRGIVLRPGVLQVLRERIVAQVARFVQARSIVGQVHSGAAPIIQVEEEVIAAALDLAQPIFVVEELLERALVTMADPSRAEGVAAWAARAITALPERARQTMAARTLAAAASLRLGEPALVVGEPPQGGGMAYLVPESAARVRVGVRLLAGAVEISVSPAAEAHVIEIPEPLFLGVGSTASPGATRWVTLEKGRSTTVPVEEVIVRGGREGSELGRALPSHGVALAACTHALKPLDRPVRPHALAVAGDDGTVEIWDTESGERLTSVHLPAPVRTLCFDSEQFVLGALSDDGTVRVIEPASGEVRELMAGVLPGPLALCHGDALAATRGGFVYRRADGSTLERESGAGARCTALALRPGDAAAAYDDGWVYQCSLDLGAELPGEPPSHGSSPDDRSRGRQTGAPPNALAWARLPGRLLAVGTTSGVKILERLDEEYEVVVELELGYPAMGVAWTSEREVMVLAEDGWARVDVRSGTVAARERYEGRTLAVSADGWITATAVAVEEVELRTITGEAFALRPTAPDVPAAAPSSRSGGPMSPDAQPARDKRIERFQPLLFISHRHADREIADVMREFVTFRSGGDVVVYQTSSSDAQVPKIGRNINRELMQALWEAEVFLLIYTSQEGGWDYCMWECGVAMRSDREDTSVIVLQCGRQLPRVFADQVAVDIRDFEKVRRFVNAFLTDPGFFPGRDEAVTRFQSNDANVARATQALYEDLQAVVRPDDAGQVEEWHAMPFVQLELTPSQVLQITEQDDDRQAQATTLRMLFDASVLTADRESAALFARPSLPVGESFGHILPRNVREGQPPDWLKSLASQMTRAARWNFPGVRWGLMRSANENDATWYGPVLTHVRRFPSKAMQFDIHFHRFAAAPDARAISLPLPEGWNADAGEASDS